MRQAATCKAWEIIMIIHPEKLDPNNIHCPLCGKSIEPNACDHVVALFLENAYDGNGCHYLAPDLREKYFIHLPVGFPRNQDECIKLKRTSKPFREFLKQNDTVRLSFESKYESTYECPVMTVFFRELT